MPARPVQADSDRPLNSSAEQLLDATSALLAERTAMQVSHSDIAKRAGLNAALIKYYFGNKNGLLLALLERNAEDAMASLGRLARMPIPAEQKLRAHISGVINAFHRAPWLNRLINYMIEYSDADSSRRIGEIYVEPMLAAYRAIIDQGVAEGTLRPVDPKFLYHGLIGACEHMFNATYSGPGPLGRARVGEEVKQAYLAFVTETFLHGLLVERRAGAGRPAASPRPGQPG